MNQLPTILFSLLPLFFSVVLGLSFVVAAWIVCYRQDALELRLWEAHTQEILQQETLSLQENSRFNAQTQHNDMRRHYCQILALLEERHIDEAQSYLESLTRLQLKAMRRYADHPIANSAMTAAAHRCEDAGIQFSVSGSFPARLDLASADLASLLCNLLNNAVEGAMAAKIACPAAEVKVHFVTAAGRLLIQIENSALPTAQLHGKTTKSHAELHGFGTRIIQDIVKRYDGSYTLQYTGPCRVCATVDVCVQSLATGSTGKYSTSLKASRSVIS